MMVGMIADISYCKVANFLSYDNVFDDEI